MGSFLEKLLLHTKFTTASFKVDFLPRRIGLGYEMNFESSNKSVIKPLLKAIRKTKEVKEILEDTASEEIDRFKHMSKKLKK